jgi:hypothetical protein
MSLAVWPEVNSTRGTLDVKPAVGVAPHVSDRWRPERAVASNDATIGSACSRVAK